MEKKGVPIPIRGAANATPFVANPRDFAPANLIGNVRPRDASEDRPRFDRRPGMKKVFEQRVGGGRPGQAIITVAKASQVTGYVVPPPGDDYIPCRDIGDIRSIESGTLAGNLWELDGVPIVYDQVGVDVSGLGGPATCTVIAVAKSRDGTKYALAVNYDVGTKGQTTIELRNAADHSLEWRYTIAHATIDRSTRNRGLFFSTEAVWICTDAWLHGVWIDDGTAVYDTAAPGFGVYGGIAGDYDLNGYSGETVEGVCYGGTPVGGGDGTERIVLAFNGTITGSGGSPGPVVDDGPYAQQFRAGVMLFGVNSQASIGIGLSPLVQVEFGGVAADAAFQEGNHGYFRLSERSDLAPRGGLITGMARGPDGQIAITRTNAGCGPTSTYPPDGSILRLVCICQITAAGAMDWENDVGSVLEPGQLGYYNDAPVPGESQVGNEPTLTCVAYTPQGDLIVAGRQTNSLYSVHKLRGEDGELLWATDLTGASDWIRAIVIDPVDGNPVLVGERTTGWTGSGGAQANLWKLDNTTGAVIAHFDLGSQVDAYDVDSIGDDGHFIYGTDEVT
jgi:hypothetical protein